MSISDEKFYAQRDANFKDRVYRALFDDHPNSGHSDEEVLELITKLKAEDNQVSDLMEKHPTDEYLAVTLSTDYKEGYIGNQLEFLSEVLKDFCIKHNLEFLSADDLLFDPSNELTEYQHDWLVGYCSTWDIISSQEHELINEHLVVEASK